MDARFERIRRRRRLAVARNAILSAVLVAAAWAVWPQQGQAPPPGARATRVTPAADPWQPVISRLDECRLRLLAGRDRLAVEDCYAPDSPARTADTAALEALLSRGVEFSALPIEVVSVALIDRRWSDGGEFVRLAVVDRLAENSVRVDGRGVTLPGRGESRWEVTLWRAAATGAWTWYEVSAAQRRTPAPASAAAR